MDNKFFELCAGLWMYADHAGLKYYTVMEAFDKETVVPELTPLLEPIWAYDDGETFDHIDAFDAYVSDSIGAYHCQQRDSQYLEDVARAAEVDKFVEAMQ